MFLGVFSAFISIARLHRTRLFVCLTYSCFGAPLFVCLFLTKQLKAEQEETPIEQFRATSSKRGKQGVSAGKFERAQRQAKTK